MAVVNSLTSCGEIAFLLIAFFVTGELMLASFTASTPRRRVMFFVLYMTGFVTTGYILLP